MEIEEADKPNLVGDLTYANDLPSKHGAEVDLAVADADAAALRDEHGAIVERMFGRIGSAIERAEVDTARPDNGR